ncbi:23S rRNA (adenine(2030)-N(6))-methyltransferase RlmJ [Catenovulum sp. 2E275]|uniref:23S rRNA (adenine(2030)-N(6))-methyltransferase RlmJ n=1 Tax=Catenovulum sp. 2E275 TaxID=2980497 RepID=UPI0021D1C219|nr:23S rRNA (adenine(2030)-N(6))-methyltransferase RlmJ [Catenovulum sp. 2E275]MCU4674893.1 23S rRNA (adenine(2030)-N(6))-methyltransferase RlmJ [Catenovulum sp. 2E275]
MLSYRHSFHAGNHADVLKHLVQLGVIEKLKQKNKPFVYLDTHSGRGIYDLASDEANKTSEYKQGIEQLLSQHSGRPELVQNYLDLLGVDKQGNCSQYLGSPELARLSLRDTDSLVLMELHNNEIRLLKQNMRADERVSVHHRDGFEGLGACVPPKPARGLVLIDPAYEVKQDYQQVVKQVSAAYKKWATGIYLIWYPVLASSRDYSHSLIKQLSAQGFKNMLKIELAVSEQQQDFGMHGSGMLVINAPFQLDLQIKQVTDWLLPLLAQDDQAYVDIEWLVKPE